MLLPTMLGCASYNALAIGEALVVADGHREGGLAVEASQGTGSSDAKRSAFVEWRGRALVSPSHQQIGGLVGFSQLRWVGERAPLWFGLGGGLGVEHTTGIVFIEPLVQGRVGTGFVLHEEIETQSAFNPWAIEAAPQHIDPMRQVDRIYEPPRVIRKRTLLTLHLVGNSDARFTRDPLYALSFLIGIAHVDEPRSGRR